MPSERVLLCTCTSHLLPRPLARFEDGADDFGRLAPIGLTLAQITPVHPGQVALPILIHHAPHLHVCLDGIWKHKSKSKFSDGHLL